MGCETQNRYAKCTRPFPAGVRDWLARLGLTGEVKVLDGNIPVGSPAGDGGGGRGHGTSGKCDDTCTLLSGTGISPKLLEDGPGGVCARTGKAVSG